MLAVGQRAPGASGAPGRAHGLSAMGAGVPRPAPRPALLQARHSTARRGRTACFCPAAAGAPTAFIQSRKAFGEVTEAPTDSQASSGPHAAWLSCRRSVTTGQGINRGQQNNTWPPRCDAKSGVKPDGESSGGEARAGPKFKAEAGHCCAHPSGCKKGGCARDPHALAQGQRWVEPSCWWPCRALGHRCPCGVRAQCDVHDWFCC